MTDQQLRQSAVAYFPEAAESLIVFAKSDAAKEYWQDWVRVEERKPDVKEGEDNSENVFAICDGRLMIMAWCYIEAGEESGFAWCNCYGEINGDPEFDDDYKPTLWMALPKLPNQ